MQLWYQIQYQPYKHDNAHRTIKAGGIIMDQLDPRWQPEAFTIPFWNQGFS